MFVYWPRKWLIAIGIWKGHFKRNWETPVESPRIRRWVLLVYVQSFLSFLRPKNISWSCTYRCTYLLIILIFELVLVYVFVDVGRRWRDSDGGVRFVKRPRDIDRQIDFTRVVSGLDIYYIILFVIKTFAWKPTTTTIYIFVHLIRKNHNGIVLYWFSVTMVSHGRAERSYKYNIPI